MTSDTTPFDDEIFEAESFRNELIDEGWTQTPSYDLVSPSSRVWAQTTFTTGEYTITASRKPRGAGPHQDQVRIRITKARAQSHPGIGIDLARGLIDFEEDESSDKPTLIWPTNIWDQHLESNT